MSACDNNSAIGVKNEPVTLSGHPINLLNSIVETDEWGDHT
jgi:hypothetical protein